MSLSSFNCDPPCSSQVRWLSGSCLWQCWCRRGAVQSSSYQLLAKHTQVRLLEACWQESEVFIRKDTRILGPTEDNTLKIEERMKSAVELLSAGATYIGSVRLSPQYVAVIRRIAMETWLLSWILNPRTWNALTLNMLHINSTQFDSDLLKGNASQWNTILKRGEWGNKFNWVEENLNEKVFWVK